MKTLIRGRWVPTDLVGLGAEARKNFASQQRRKRLLNSSRRRLLPPQSYTMDYRKECVAAAILRHTGGSRQYAVLVDPWTELPAGLDPSQEYKVIAKLRDQVYGSGFNPGVFTAEGKQAFDMIGNAARSLRLGLMALARRDVRGVLAAFTFPPNHRGEVRRIVQGRAGLPSRFLELQYGWRPLLSDMEEGAQYLAYASVTPGVGRVSARRTWASAASWGGDPPGGNLAAYANRLTVHELTIRAFVTSKSKPFVPSLASLATVAYEKTPWSFVLDWVVPIGPFLESLRTKSDIQGKFVRSYKTTTYWWGSRPARGFSVSGYLAEAPFKKRVVFSRQVTDALSVPYPVTLLADPITRSWERAANAVALLAQSGPRILAAIKR